MSADIILNDASEEEVKKRRAQLAVLEDKLADGELELAMLKTNLDRFGIRYYREVGYLYVELDGIEEQIAAAEARLKYKNRKSREREAWTQWAREHAKRWEGRAELLEESKPQATESLRKLWREVAKSVHPDLAVDEVEQNLREKLMVEANLAFQDRDEARLRAVLTNSVAILASLRDRGVEAELIRIIRKITQAEERLRAIDITMTQLKESHLYRLMVRAEEAEKEGGNLLAEMAAQVKQQISDAKRRLVAAVAKRAGHPVREILLK